MLRDRYGRTIEYLRLSVTDRCDLRCTYCMPTGFKDFEEPADWLTFDEITRLLAAFARLGTRRVRLTGGEPLLRRHVTDLAARIAAIDGITDLSLSTNATQLLRHATALKAAGVGRINVSLDTLDRACAQAITGRDIHAQVMEGLMAGKAAGFDPIKINMVALRGLNEHEIAPMLAWVAENDMDLSLIETMPMGLIDEDRADRFLPLPEVLARLKTQFELTADSHDSGGPARYWRVGGTSSRLGLISPLTNNFCASCNRVRLSTDGRLHMCLGHEDSVDLKAAIRSGGLQAVDDAIDRALAAKPERHDFRIEAGAAPAVSRHMSVTGG